jgi:hypothetical protein
VESVSVIIEDNIPSGGLVGWVVEDMARGTIVVTLHRLDE